MQQLGKAFSVIARQLASEEMAHDEVDAYYAPSECHGLVKKHMVKKHRLARRYARSISGLNRCQFRIALERNERAIDRARQVIVERWYAKQYGNK